MTVTVRNTYIDRKLLKFGKALFSIKVMIFLDRSLHNYENWLS